MMNSGRPHPELETWTATASRTSSWERGKRTPEAEPMPVQPMLSLAATDLLSTRWTAKPQGTGWGRCDCPSQATGPSPPG